MYVIQVEYMFLYFVTGKTIDVVTRTVPFGSNNELAIGTFSP